MVPRLVAATASLGSPWACSAPGRPSLINSGWVGGPEHPPTPTPGDRIKPKCRSFWVIRSLCPQGLQKRALHLRESCPCGDRPWTWMGTAVGLWSGRAPSSSEIPCPDPMTDVIRAGSLLLCSLSLCQFSLHATSRTPTPTSGPGVPALLPPSCLGPGSLGMVGVGGLHLAGCASWTLTAALPTRVTLLPPSASCVAASTKRGTCTTWSSGKTCPMTSAPGRSTTSTFPTTTT